MSCWSTRIEPLRIAFYPDNTLEVIMGSSQSTTAVLSPKIMNLEIRSSQHHLVSSPTLLLSFNSSHNVGEHEQAEMIKSGIDQRLSDIEKILRENKKTSQEMKEMRRQITKLMQEVKEHNNKVMALQLEAREKDDKVALIQSQMLELQNQDLDLQNQALDKPAILQKHAHWDPIRILENKFRLHFLCEFGDHTMEASKSKENQIHIGKHDGYEIKNDTEFYKMYGKYMLILMQSLKLEMKSADISIPHISLPTLLNAGIDFSIKYMEVLSKDNPTLNNASTIDNYEGLKGTDFNQLDIFLRINDQNKELASLYRTVTGTGHVKWVCNEHYRLTYQEENQKAFAKIIVMDVEATPQSIDSRAIKKLVAAIGTNTTLTTLNLGFSSIGNEGAIALSEALKTNTTLTNLSTQDQHQFDHFGLGDNSIGNSEAFALSEALKTNTALTTLHLNDNSIGNEGAIALSEALATNTTLTALNLSDNSIGNSDTFTLSGVLMINTTLTTLDLRFNSIGNSEAFALSDALKTNTTLTVLYLSDNSIGNEGALALSEALKINTALTTLNLRFNSTGNEGAIAL
ncbi:hypothetical protein BGZ46_010123 [Entomortierella lignicola]|nr:hypothetical protein BGZ46_010123 [Entomortierella lignicola]